MPHKPFHLYKRPTTKKGKYIYYCQFFDDTGVRMSGISTGQTTKAAAVTWAVEQIKKGIIAANKNITFAQYAKDWWIWDRCKYIKGKRARGSSMSQDYADSMRSYLVNHILPKFGNNKLQKINTRMIEAWIMELRKKPGRLGNNFSPTTVNHCLKCLKIMLKEAKRLGYINIDPAESVHKLKETPRKRSILSIDEVKEIFLDDNIGDVWNGDLVHYTINLLAASTGARMGECQALMIKNVHNDYVGIFFISGVENTA